MKMKINDKKIISLVIPFSKIGNLEDYQMVECITLITVSTGISHYVQQNIDHVIVTKTTTWADPRTAGPVCILQRLKRTSSRDLVRAFLRSRNEILYDLLIVLGCTIFP